MGLPAYWETRGPSESWMFTILLPSTALFLFVYVSFQVKRHCRGSKTEKVTSGQSGIKTSTAASPSKPCEYRSLYYQLHNIEDHQDFLPEAHRLLLFLLSDAVTTSNPDSQQGIFAIKNFNPESLLSFLHTSHQDVEDSYQKYIQDRKAGQPRVLVSNREQAAKVLKQLAPLKLVDGAWLGHIHQVTTPFNLRRITKQVWQVLSEELGDGNRNLNHVYVYNELLKEVGVNLPAPHAREFPDSFHDIQDSRVFKAGVVQLLISLFPLEFLPEILGFNLHFEGLSFETMVLSRELQELKIDAQYFLLHISIDNAHSGHAMMAAHTVAEYLAQIERDEGLDAARIAWKRIQAGYSLSKHQLDAIEFDYSKSSEHIIHNNHTPETPYDNEVSAMLMAKAAVAQKIHTACPAKIGGRPLSEWLDLRNRKGADVNREFLRELSNAKPWVIKGKPDASRLIREVRLGGRMFGAFTMKEAKLLENWIEALDSPVNRQDVYWTFTGRSKDAPITGLLPPSGPFPGFELSTSAISDSDVTSIFQPLSMDIAPNWSRFIPLWFAHISLLESCVAVPSRVATDLGAAIIRVLRAQYAFSREVDGVSGMDEFNQTPTSDLVDLGLEMMARKDPTRPLPGSLADILTEQPSAFAQEMLNVSRYPVRNMGYLVGMALLFLDLKRVMLRSPTLLSDTGRDVLKEIIEREDAGLKACYELLQRDRQKLQQMAAGYRMAKEEVEESLKVNCK